MAVAIDQIEVETRSDSASSDAPQTEPVKAKPDPREIERALNARRERLARVHAH